jgi:hypothetical protein
VQRTARNTITIITIERTKWAVLRLVTPVAVIALFVVPHQTGAFGSSRSGLGKSGSIAARASEPPFIGIIRTVKPIPTS